MVEESILIKFDDKEPDNKMSELFKSFSEIYVSEDTSDAGGSEATKSSEAGGQEVDPTAKAHPDEEDFEKARDGSEEATHSKKTFKYNFFTSRRSNRWK